jgi:protein-S-isoprenylcysteine O-methyltransferase Ste14
MNGDASSRFLWPPTIFGLGFVAAVVLSWILPLHFLPRDFALVLRILGGLVVVAAVALVLAAERAFKSVGTPVRPTEPTREIVTNGVYAHTRNPMYLSMTIGLIGTAFVANSLWFLIAVPVAVFAVIKLAIEREELYLSRKFGEPYRVYKTRVRRWF